MKYKIFKIVAIFLLFISLFRTGLISTFLNDVNLFLLGGTFFWIIILMILSLILSFSKKKTQNYFKKYIIALILAGISIELILNLIKINI